MTRQTVAVNVGRGGNAGAGRPVPQGLWKPDHDRTYSYSASGGAAAGMHAYLGAHLTAHKVAGMRAKNLLGLPWRMAFAGAGTTGLAALQLGRRITGLELSPQFTALAVERLAQAGNEHQGSGGQP